MESKARVVYGSVYNIPEEIGAVHVSTFGSVLLHLRDPFLALQKASTITTEMMIVTDRVPTFERYHVFSVFRILGKFDPRFAKYFVPDLVFLPDPDKREPWETWWSLSPDLVSRFLRILGFSKLRVSYHSQKFLNGTQHLYTVVATRT